jgi:hypothetical protein
MGMNTLALLEHLTSSDADLSKIHHSHDTVFFSALGGLVFVMTSQATAAKGYYALATLVAVFVANKMKHCRPAAYVAATLGVGASFLGGVIAANVVALIADFGFGKPLSW